MVEQGGLEGGVVASQYRLLGRCGAGEVAAAGTLGALVGIPERQGVGAGLLQNGQQAHLPRFGYAPGHNGFAAHPVAEGGFGFKHQGTGPGGGHSGGQGGTADAAADDYQVVIGGWQFRIPLWVVRGVCPC